MPDIAWFERRVQDVISACEAMLDVMPRVEAQPLEVALEVAREFRRARPVARSALNVPDKDFVS